MHQSGLFDEETGKAGEAGEGWHRQAFRPTVEGFLEAAYQALEAEYEPDQIWWIEDSHPRDTAVAVKEKSRLANQEFRSLAKFAALNRAEDRWSLMYQILWRLTHGEPFLLALKGDPLVARLVRYEKSVRRDLHKMKAFVRFRSLGEGEDERFVAWFEPEHYIVSAAASFFSRRFSAMRWSVLTPLGCAHWEGAGELHFSPGLSEAVKASDDLDRLWKVYYRNIFNPARVKTDAMRAEMPQKYWKNLPEAELIPALLLEANAKLDQMLQSTPEPLPVMNCGERPESYTALLRSKTAQAPEEPLSRLQASVMTCEGCERWESATQAVSGEGPVDARIMLVGEQPGDQEDLVGHPFVGPAGKLLDEVLDELGVSRESLYLTNAVKHFGFKVSGRRRLHERPRERHIHACRHWLEQEIAIVDPDVIVCLGVTAASAVLGRTVKLNQVQHQALSLEGRAVIATLHPAAILRAAAPSIARGAWVNELARAFTLVST